MEEYKVGDYQIFDEAGHTVNKLNTELDTSKASIADCKTKLSDSSIFMGPIADECSDTFAKVDQSISNLMTNFKTIENYLAEVSSNYKSGDVNAAKLLLMGADGMLSVGSTQTYASEKDIPKVSVEQITSCNSVQEYLDLVMPIYTYYCQKYGIKYPGALALQPVHECSAPKGLTQPVALKDNNLGGLKYSPSIPNATPGSYPSDGTGGQYSHFNSITEYIEAHCWNIGHEGSYYQEALSKDNVNDFTHAMVKKWVGPWGKYGSDIVKEYSEYGLDKYELA